MIAYIIPLILFIVVIGSYFAVKLKNKEEGSFPEPDKYIGYVSVISLGLMGVSVLLGAVLQQPSISPIGLLIGIALAKGVATPLIQKKKMNNGYRVTVLLCNVLMIFVTIAPFIK